MRGWGRLMLADPVPRGAALWDCILQRDSCRGGPGPGGFSDGVCQHSEPRLAGGRSATRWPREPAHRNRSAGAWGALAAAPVRADGHGFRRFGWRVLTVARFNRRRGEMAENFALCVLAIWGGKGSF